MGEKTADNQTPLLQTQPADFPLKWTGLFSLLPVHPCLFPSFTLNSIVMIKKSFVWLWIKIQGLQTSLFFRLIKFPWIKNSLSFFFFFLIFIFLCAKVVFMFHGIMRELENEMGNIEVHFWKKNNSWGWFFNIEYLNCEGNIWTAVEHIMTGVIGSGVLSLAWSMAQLGWIAGPLAVLFFALITFISTFLLCNCCWFPDPEYGPGRNRSYLEAVHMSLGKLLILHC